jgi:hypothetical protein
MAARHGFKGRAADQVYRLAKPFGWAGFHIAVIPNPNIDFEVAADVGLRWDAIERLVAAAEEPHPLIKDKDKVKRATIGCEFGNIKGTGYRTRTVASERDIPSVTAALEDELTAIGLPYINRYSEIGELLALLSRNDLEATLSCPLHDSRCKRAVAAAIVAGRDDLVDGIVRQSETFLSDQDHAGLPAFLMFVSRLRAQRGKA